MRKGQTIGEMARIRKMSLGWLTQQRFNALSEDNKVRIIVKIIDKELPNTLQFSGQPLNVRVVMDDDGNAT